LHAVCVCIWVAWSGDGRVRFESSWLQLLCVCVFFFFVFGGFSVPCS